MERSAFFRFLMLLVLLIAFAPAALAKTGPGSTDTTPGEGSLLFKKGEKVIPVPLKKTDVKISVVGFVASIEVEQIFVNPYKENIEATYIFPLPSESAVDDLEIKIGKRIIRGTIKEREEARKEYEAARNSGRRAALVEQERPNIFTTNVANIGPRKKIVVRIHYTERLAYDDGGFRLSFPMVVAPRYIPGNDAGASAVTDASRITPPTISPEFRPGTDIFLNVEVDAGIPITDIRSLSHDIKEEKVSDGSYRIGLTNLNEIPNRDFILEYKLAGAKPQAAVLKGVNDKGDGYFLLLAMPPSNSDVKDLRPKEFILIVDNSGSMMGQKFEQAKKALRICMQGLNPQDSFNIIRFSSDFSSMSETSVPFTKENLALADQYITGLQVEGGTEILKPLMFAMEQPQQPDKMRVIVFFTDGQVGNEAEILRYVSQHKAGSRIFTFGIDTAVNEFFLKKLAQLGRGTAEFLLPSQQDIEPVIERFQRRVSSPVLTDVSIDWSGIDVSEVFPEPLPDLYLRQPLFVVGKFRPGKSGDIALKARGGSEGTTSLFVSMDTSVSNAKAETIAAIWARARIEKLSDKLLETPEDEKLKQEIKDLALSHHLVSQFTSFVAIDQQIVATGGRPSRQVTVPVATPAGWSGSAPCMAKLSSLSASLKTDPGANSLASRAKDSKTGPTQLKDRTVPESAKNPDRAPGTPLKMKEEKARVSNPSSNGPSIAKNSSPSIGNTVTTNIPQPAAIEPSKEKEEVRPSPLSSGPGRNLEESEGILRYLAEQQSPSGLWGNDRNLDTLRTTALAALVFISSGNSTNHSGYQHTIRRAVNYIAANVDQDGMLRGSSGHRDQTEIHSLALWVLAEDLRYSSNFAYKRAAILLMNGLLKLRDSNGLWLSKEGGKPSIKATVWAAIALSGCRRAGIGGGEQLYEVAKHLQSKGKYKLESVLVMQLAGQKMETDKLSQLASNLLARDWRTINESQLDRAFFAMIFLRRFDKEGLEKIETQIKELVISNNQSIDFIALRYLAVTVRLSSLALY